MVLKLGLDCNSRKFVLKKKKRPGGGGGKGEKRVPLTLRPYKINLNALNLKFLYSLI